MRVAWCTDLHLDSVPAPDRARFLSRFQQENFDAVLVGGDTGVAYSLSAFLDEIAAASRCPVHYVLGNHDFYGGASKKTREGGLAGWLPASGIVELTSTVGLVGHDGWADCRLGDYTRSRVLMTDFYEITELENLSREARRRRMEELGDDAAQHFASVLPAALGRFQTVVALTHVPPFRAACWYNGEPSNDDYLPFFACKAVGDVLLSEMQARPDRRLLVLCGHTHGRGVVNILPNLEVRTAGVIYGSPAIQEVLYFDS